MANQVRKLSDNEKKFFNTLKKLKGKRIKDVFFFNGGVIGVDEGFVITIDNGKKGDIFLGGIDGEYGDNALMLYNKDDINKMKNIKR